VNRRSLLLFAALFLAMLAVIAVAVSRYKPKEKLMYCGHPKEFRFPLMPYAKTHCGGLRAISYLRTLYLAQCFHQSETGTNATTFEELGVMFPTNYIRYGLTMTSDGTNWSAQVPKQIGFAGHFLITSAGRLHFHATQPATTNDHVLHNWSQ
jgi:hypothetical protein